MTLDANAPQPIVNLRRVNIIKVVPAPHRISSCLLRQQTEYASEFMRVIRPTAECHLLALSRHQCRLDECPFLGAKRTFDSANCRIAKGSFDHLVGGSLQRQRHGDAKRLRGLEIDDELEFGRLLHRKVAGFFTFEDAIDVGRSSPE